MRDDDKQGGEVTERGMRMRDPVQSVYNRQVAKCLRDIGEVFELPAVVVERIKRAIEYTCKDVDKLRNKNPNGGTHAEEKIHGNR
jgi:hypothetical protein